MKKNFLIASIAIILSVLCFTACEYENPKESKLGTILAGEHQLVKMRENTTQDGMVSGTFFLFFGSLKGSSNTGVSVTFSWKRNDGTYGINTLPIEKIRVLPKPGTEIPSIKFCWNRWKSPDVQDAINQGYVLYAIVTCDPRQWTVDVKMPLENK